MSLGVIRLGRTFTSQVDTDMLMPIARSISMAMAWLKAIVITGIPMTLRQSSLRSASTTVMRCI